MHNPFCLLLLSVLEPGLFCLDVLNDKIHISGIAIDLIDIVDLLHGVDVDELLLEFEAVEMIPISGMIILCFLVVRESDGLLRDFLLALAAGGTIGRCVCSLNELVVGSLVKLIHPL